MKYSFKYLIKESAINILLLGLILGFFAFTFWLIKHIDSYNLERMLF